MFLSSLKMYFKHGPCGVVPCVQIQGYHMVRLNTCILHHSAGSMFEIEFETGWTFFRFKLHLQILNCIWDFK